MFMNDQTANQPVVLCLCQEDNHRKLIPPYASAFRDTGVKFRTVELPKSFDEPLGAILERLSETPSWIFHFESDFPLLPQGIEASKIPTMTFQVDTYSIPKRRAHWSALFDHVAVFHPGYDQLFQDLGHPGAFLHPHAVRRELFEGPDLEREFEIGWVGQSGGPLYRRRAFWLPRLAASFQMNDWKRRHSLEEVACIYRRSRVVVNFGRDDFPQDANMRVFEVLASGALLVTSLPSELTELGFIEGEHFAGYHEDQELPMVIRRYLDDEDLRKHIAEAGRVKALSEHTYHNRAQVVLSRLAKSGACKLAPAAKWAEPHVRLSYLDFFDSHGQVDLAVSEFRHIAGHGFHETIKGAALLGKGRLRRARATVKSKLQRIRG